MRITNLLRHAHSFLEAITSVVLAVIMALVVVDAAMRYLWNYPLGFVYEITTLYLLVALFFLALSGSYTGGHHIRIHVIFEMLGAGAKRWAFLITESLAVIFFTLVTIEAGKTLWASIHKNEVISGLIAWYTWPKYAFVFVGTLLLTINLIVTVLMSLSRVLSGETAEDAQ